MKILKNPCQGVWKPLAGVFYSKEFMNGLLDICGEQTMSSLQIAELTGKRHDAVLRDVRNLLEQGVNAHNFVAVEYTDAKGEHRPCYNLSKTGCLILASGYNAVLREKIINRWIELESANYPRIPTTFAEALRLAADKAEENERLIAENARLSSKVSEMKPKAYYYDLILRSSESLVVTQIAKDYGMSPQRFNKTLRALGIQYKVNGQWVLYAKYQGEGYTDSTTGCKRNSSDTWTATVWTQRGRLFLYTMLKEADILPVMERPSGYRLPKFNDLRDEDDFYR